MVGELMDLYLDTETIGLNGPVKLIQYAVDDGPVQFIKFPAQGCSDLNAFQFIRNILFYGDTTLIGWNTTFDLFHLYRLLYTWGFGKYPFKCQVLDLYNHAALKGPFSAFAFSGRSKSGGKKVAAVRRVPLIAAPAVEAAVLERLTPLVPGKLTCHHHEVPGRKDLVTLSWSCDVSLSLKAHAAYWGEEVLKLADVWPLPRREDEKLWLCSYTNPNGSLAPPYDRLEGECDRILRDDSSPFFVYARKDIDYLRLARSRLGSPHPGAHDVATNVVAYTRYCGIPVGRDILESTKDHYKSELTRIERLLSGCDLKSPVQRKALLQKYEPLVQSTKKEVLQALVNLGGPAKDVAAAMLRYGSLKQKYDQTCKAGESTDGRLHPDLRVLGTATGRMSGTGGFNAQGVGKLEKNATGQDVGLRAALQTVAVGDFHQFELAIAASAWRDDRLLRDLDEGRDVHLATAIECHPKLRPGPLHLSYEEAVRRKRAKDPLVLKCRDECKRMVFGILYGCTEQKIADVFGVTNEEAGRILSRFYTLYPGLAAFKRGVEARFCTADTEHWDRGSVARMDASETDLTGFSRSWQFERDVASVLWALGNEGLSGVPGGMVVRQVHKGPQPIAQAVRSAFLGAAISIQQAMFRQAANMRIQATGANLCKALQARLWQKFHCPMLNVHDELVFPAHENFDYDKVAAEVADFCEEHRHLVKHLRFDLARTERWADK